MAKVMPVLFAISPRLAIVKFLEGAPFLPSGKMIQQMKAAWKSISLAA